ncbi:hypothetical protein EDB89DRAFT_1912011 [Lactarius sanguifluus]|nr:hypothetical protein EDB89DRAFT_1912011 [Lactarius sanguifluus]
MERRYETPRLIKLNLKTETEIEYIGPKMRTQQEGGEDNTGGIVGRQLLATLRVNGRFGGSTSQNLGSLKRVTSSMSNFEETSYRSARSFSRWGRYASRPSSISSIIYSTQGHHGACGALILDALNEYAKETGIDLTENQFSTSLQGCNSPDEILQLIRDKAKAFKEFREGNRKLINWLKPVVQVVHLFAGTLGEGISTYGPAAAAKAVFAGVDVLIVTASKVSAGYDALVDLFECIGNFLKRLHHGRNTLCSGLGDEKHQAGAFQ